MLMSTMYIAVKKKESTILHNFAVPAVSGVPNAVKVTDTDELKTCAARLTRMVEYAFSLMWSAVIRGNRLNLS